MIFILAIIPVDCPDDCASNLTPVVFDTCPVHVQFGRITRIYVTAGDGLADWTSGAEWATRLDDAAGSLDSVVTYKVIGSSSVPTTTDIEISDERIIEGIPEWELTFQIDEISQENWDHMREVGNCRQEVKFWFSNKSNGFFGGDDGIDANIRMYPDHTEGVDDVLKIIGTLKWKDQFTYEFLPVRPF